MTVKTLLESLKELVEHGHGQDIVQALDSDAESWQEVTGFIYSGKQASASIRLYTDDIN